MDNYTGPYWSNGRIQSSIEFGNEMPMDEVDFESRLHDTAFAHYGDQRHRIAADWIYKQNLDKIPGFKARAVENIPFYGNLIDATTLAGLFTPVLPFVLGDYVLRAKRTKRAVQAGEYNKEIADVLNLYKTDPYNMGGVLAPVVYPEAFAKQPKRHIRVGPTTDDIPKTQDPAPGGYQGEPTTPGVDTTPVEEVSIDVDGNIVSRSDPPTAAPDVVFANVVNAATMLGKENLEILSGIDRLASHTVTYSPYQPLKRKRKKITQKDVDLYNRYHSTSYTLAEVQAVKGLYL